MKGAFVGEKNSDVSKNARYNNKNYCIFSLKHTETLSKSLSC